MCAETNTLCIDSKLNDNHAICVNLPNKAVIPPQLLERLDILEARHPDKTLYVSVDRVPNPHANIDVKKSDPGFAYASRLFSAIEGNPFNNRKLDAQTHTQRVAEMQRFQTDFFVRAVLPILKITALEPLSATSLLPQPARTHLAIPSPWPHLDLPFPLPNIPALPPLHHERIEAARRILELTADFRHLFDLSQFFYDQAMAPSMTEAENERFLLAAEDFAFLAMRFASRTWEGQQQYVNRLHDHLWKVQLPLQVLHEKKHLDQIAKPYVLASMGTPMTATESQLKGTEGGAVFFSVAVPLSWIEDWDKRGINHETVIRDYFNQEQQMFLRPAVFMDQSVDQTYALKAVVVQRDRPGPDDDMYGGVFSQHVDQARLSRTLFNNEPRLFYYVGFVLTDPAKAAELLQNRDIKKFDLLLMQRGSAFRNINGGFVVQKDNIPEITDWYLGDPHVKRDDWLNIRTMALGMLAEAEKDSLLQLPAEKQRALEEINRFYTSINDRLIGYLELAEQAYRDGRKHRDFLLGDITDYMNVALTLQKQGYYLTNVRLFIWMIERYEGILYTISGNHDHHGRKYPDGLSPRNFFIGKYLRPYLKYADAIRFPDTGGDNTDGLKALFTRATEDGDDDVGFFGFMSTLIGELYAKNEFEKRNDDFLAPFIENVGQLETFSFKLGNGFRIFMWPTENEDFNYMLFLLKHAPRPRRKSVAHGIDLYLNKQHASGKGPRPENIVAMIRVAEEAWKNKEWLILAGHFPPFFKGDGPNGLPDTEDALQLPSALVVRLVQWYYRGSDGRPTLRLSMAGHTHEYSETVFDIYFEDVGKKSRFRTQLGNILREANPKTIVSELWNLSREWDLPKRMHIRRVTEPGKNGFPGPLAQASNRGELNLPLAITTSALAGSLPAYHVVKTKSDGSMKIDMHLLHERADGLLTETPASLLTYFEQQRRSALQNWDPELAAKIEPHHQPKDGEAPLEFKYPEISNEDRWDAFPMVYAYAGNSEIGLHYQLDLGYDFRRGFEVRNNISLLFPASDQINPIFGGPNYWFLGFSHYLHVDKPDDSLRHRADLLQIKGGLNTGIWSPAFTVGYRISDNAVEFGTEQCLEPPIPFLPKPCLSARVDQRGEPFFGITLGTGFTTATYRYNDNPIHPVQLPNSFNDQWAP